MRYFTLLLLFSCFHLNGQSLKLSGRVIDENNEPVIGANVFLTGTYDGASTDLEGVFSFTTTEKGAFILSISYLGYENWSQDIVLENESFEFDIKLTPATSELDAVVITAGAFEASDSKKSVTLRPLDIVTTAGANGDVLGALQTLPGAQRVGEDGRLFVRGGAAYETRTFIDGLYVAQPYTSTTPNVPSRGRFSPVLFKGTTFSTGGYSAEYGQALSSALVLETQDLAPATLTAISLMSVGGNLSHTQRWEQTSVAVSADYTNLGPYMNLVPQNLQWKKAPRTAGGQLIFRHKSDNGSLWKLQAQHHQSGMSLKTLNPQQLSDSLEVSLKNTYTYLGTSFQKTLGAAWHLQVSAAYTDHLDKTATIADIRSRETALLAKARLSRSLGQGHLLRLGVSHWRESFEERLQVPEATFLQEQQEPYTAFFTEADWTFSKKLVARTGIRAEMRHVSDELVISPRLSVAYKTGAKSQVSFATGRFTQRPQKAQILSTPMLEMEEAWHFITNWQWQKDGRTLRVEAYRKSYDDLASITPTGWKNTGDGYAQGLDVFFRDKVSIANSDFWVSYSYLDTERRYERFTERIQPPFAAKHTVNLVYKYWIPRWQSLVGMTAVYATPRNYYHQTETEMIQGKTTAYRDVSMNWSYLTQLKGHLLIIHCSVNNLPGFENNYGQQFSQQPEADGSYASVTIRPPAKRFLFLGVFLSIGKEGASQF
jgi:hypothetical protein